MTAMQACGNQVLFRSRPMIDRLSSLAEQGREIWRAFRLSPHKLSLLAQIPWSDIFHRNTRILVVGAASLLLAVALLSLIFSGGNSFEQKSALLSLQLTDDHADRWVLEIVAGQPRDRLKQNQPGSPLSVLADVKIQGREASIGVLVLGQADEQYVTGARKNSVWEAPPTFKILDEAGSELAAGRFKYG
jgi:hypothetical protein